MQVIHFSRGGVITACQAEHKHMPANWTFHVAKVTCKRCLLWLKARQLKTELQRSSYELGQGGPSPTY